MPFVAVSGVGEGMGVLDSVHIWQGEGEVRGFHYGDAALPKLLWDDLFIHEFVYCIKY